MNWHDDEEKAAYAWLKEAFSYYAQHLPYCDSRKEKAADGRSGPFRCTCGLEDTVDRL